MYIPLKNILFLDIETVPKYENYDTLSETEQELFNEKTRFNRGDTPEPEFYKKAGIWAEFGKIVCISIGYLIESHFRQFRLRSFVGDEKKLLLDFKKVLDLHFSEKYHLLCAHNGKEFDFPYIARRMIICGVSLPKKLDYAGKKPWEIPHLDTMELWKFGDYKHYTSLKLLTHILGIDSPKDDIDGSQVADVFYKDHDLDRIAHYCENDVIAIAQVLLKMQALPLLKPEEINHVK